MKTWKRKLFEKSSDVLLSACRDLTGRSACIARSCRGERDPGAGRIAGSARQPDGGAGTHSEQVLRHADRILVIHEGRLQAPGYQEPVRSASPGTAASNNKSMAPYPGT
jgi:hypothetical protein